MEKYKSKSQLRSKKSFYQWHRQIGLAVSLLVIVLSVTGIMLNHTEEFELDSHHIKSELLLSWYGIKKPTIKSYPAGKNWLSHAGDKIYFNDKLVEKEVSVITGSVTTEYFTAVATQNEIILLTPDGEKIERLDATTGVPHNITLLGTNKKNQLVVKTKTSVFNANNDVTEWNKTTTKQIAWASTENIPSELESTLNALFRGKGLSKERVILDIHSGRILGKAGPLLMDLSAILLLVLSFTGCWMYAKRKWITYKRDQLLSAASIGESYSAADLKRGQEGIVLTVIGDDNFKQRLASMGVLAGTVIATPDSSVFGDPRTYSVRGYQLCMRTTEASMILLQTDTQTIPRLQKFSKTKAAIEDDVESNEDDRRQ